MMKKIIVPAAIAGGLFLSAAGQEAYAASGQDIVNKALQFQGTPYSYGAPAFSTSSFDCSSFTQFVFKDILGITLPRTSAAQATKGTAVSRSNLQPGDLLFFDTSGDGGIHHVGIYVGNGKMISSELTVGVHMTNVFSGGGSQHYWESRFVTARRISGTSQPAASQIEQSAAVKQNNTQSSAVYTVKSGDSLWAIARSHGTSVSAIKSANGLKTDMIYPGQRLKMSAGQASATTSSKKTAQQSSPKQEQASQTAVYTVKSGDSLWAIAHGHGTSVGAIKSANGLRSDVIYPGQKLKLSGSRAASAAQPAKQQVSKAVSSSAYKVKKGDKLWTIATLHGITVNKLMRANNLSATLIYPGQNLIIPD